MAVPGRAHQADGQAGIVHLHPADSGVPGFLRAGHFRDDGAGSAADGFRNELVAVRLGSLQGNIAGAGQNTAAVAFQMGDFHLGGAGERMGGKVFEQGK